MQCVSRAGGMDSGDEWVVLNVGGVRYEVTCRFHGALTAASGRNDSGASPANMHLSACRTSGSCDVRDENFC